MPHDIVTLRCIIATFRLLTASLHQAMRSTGYKAPFISRWSAVNGAFRFSLFRREVAPSAVRCCTILLLCFFIGGIHASGISIPLSLLMLLRSYVDSLLDPTSVPVRVSINKLFYIVPKRIMAGLVGVLRNGGGLGTGESYIPVVLFDSLMHSSPCSPVLPVRTSTVSAHAHKTGHYPLWNEVKSRLDRSIETHWYTRRVKEAIHIRS